MGYEDNYYGRGYGRFGREYGCSLEAEVYEFITGYIYDDDCCDLLKIAFSFFQSKQACITREALCALNEAVACRLIGRREFDIRYAIFQIGVEKINELIACALKRIVNRERRDDVGRNFLGYDYGCFRNEYCETSIAAVIIAGLTALRQLANFKERRFLNRTTDECTVRIIIRDLERDLEIATLNCRPRCGPCGGLEKEGLIGPYGGDAIIGGDGCKKGCGRGREWKD
jgi:hypothetical protein